MLTSSRLLAVLLFLALPAATSSCERERAPNTPEEPDNGTVVREALTFDSNGVPIHYLERGEGEPLVLIHGRGESVDGWIDAGVFDDLASDYRVIAIDLRGHGRSGKPHDPKSYGREMTLDIVRLLDHLGIPRAHIVGYSLGANLTAQLLTLHPERFLTATLAGSAGRFRWSTDDQQRFEQEAAEMEQFGFSPSQERFVAASDAFELTEDDIRTRSAAAMADSTRDRFAIAALVRSFAEQVITPDQAAAVSVPTMGIAGSEDPLLAHLQELQRLRPSLRLVVIDSATHAGDRGVLRRSEFVAAIRDFIDVHRTQNRRTQPT